MFNVHFSFFRNDKSFSFQVCLSATKGYLYSKVTFVLKNISVMVRVGVGFRFCWLGLVYELKPQSDFCKQEPRDGQ